MNLTNVFIDILRSAMTQTSCDMIEGLSTQDWEKIYDISQKQQLAPMIYPKIYGPSWTTIVPSKSKIHVFGMGDKLTSFGSNIIFLSTFS